MINLCLQSTTASLSNRLIIEKSTTVDIDKQVKFKAPNLWEWYVDNVLKYQRIPMHQKTITIIDKALNLLWNKELTGQTLFDPKVHKRHADNLFRRMMRNLRKSLIPTVDCRRKYDQLGGSKIGYFESLEQQAARKLVGMITILHAVEPLNVAVALVKAQELKDQINEYVKKIKGAALLGAIEVEVISIKELQRVSLFNIQELNKVESVDEDGVITFCVSKEDNKKTKISRKLEVFKKLSKHLKSEDIEGQSGQFLIHFHGVLKVQNHEDIENVKQQLFKNPNWSQTSHQIKFVHLSKTWNDSHKSIEKNIKHISRYITKGGVQLINENRHLKYKINFPKGMSISYEDFLKIEDDDLDSLDSVSESKYLIGQPNLSHHEINELAKVNFGMMNLNKKGNGYLVSVGKF